MLVSERVGDRKELAKCWGGELSIKMLLIKKKKKKGLVTIWQMGDIC